jgi:hypothetical protein
MMNHRDQYTIYFIKPVGMAGPIKIGLSENPKRRLNEYRAWSPFVLEMVGTVPGNWDDEQFLHECLADDHSHGEWFHPSAQVQRVIERVISAGGVDVIRGWLKPVANVRSKNNRMTRARHAAEISA